MIKGSILFQGQYISATGVNSGAPLVDNSGSLGFGLNNTEITGTTAATTTSTTDVVLATTTPIAGTYLVLFSTVCTVSAVGITVTYSLYSGGTQKADSVRAILPYDGGTGVTGQTTGAVAINGIVTVNGSQAIAVEWHTSSGTATSNARTFDVVRIA